MVKPSGRVSEEGNLVPLNASKPTRVKELGRVRKLRTIKTQNRNTQSEHRIKTQNQTKYRVKTQNQNRIKTQTQNQNTHNQHRIETHNQNTESKHIIKTHNQNT